MPCHESISDAKALFVSKVSEGISTLMECGYSRERATNALMRELNRGESASSGRPNDEEIFEAMKRYNLGIEEATKAIVISRAMRRAMVSSETPAQAIELLATKISLSNLLYDSADDSSDDDLSMIRPELRVKPVATIDRQRGKSNKPTATRKARTSVKSARPRHSSNNTSAKIVMAGRKRSIDEIVPMEKKEKRERADSVTEEISEKFASNKSNSEEAGNNNESPLLRAPVVRGKRGLRVDDSECGNQTNSHKRMRGSDGC